MAMPILAIGYLGIALQTIPFPGTGMAFPRGANANWTIVPTCKAEFDAIGGATTATVSGINCSTAKLLVLVTSCFFGTTYDAYGTTVPSDTSSNTWHRAASWRIQGNPTISIWYAYGATSTGSQGFTSGECDYPSLDLSGWAGGLASGDPKDQVCSNGVTLATVIQSCGSTLTPLFTNELVITGSYSNLATSWSINGGFTTINAPASNFVQDAYLIETSIVGVNPTWTNTTPSLDMVSFMVSFRSQ